MMEHLVRTKAWLNYQCKTVLKTIIAGPLPIGVQAVVVSLPSLERNIYVLAVPFTSNRKVVEALFTKQRKPSLKGQSIPIGFLN